MDKEYILVYDSGVGGLTTLKEIKKLLPDQNYLYFADDKNVPYGNKSGRKIYQLTKNNLDFLLKNYKIKVVVFACNTLTASCIDKFRSKYKIRFVGIEPAIFEAKRKSETRNILVLCTKLTSRQKRYKRLVKRAKVNVYTLKFKTLACDIENALLNNKKLDFISLKNEISKKLIKYEKIDTIVLGCTHYSFLKGDLERMFNIGVLDGNVGVAKRVKWLIGEEKRNFLGSETKILLSSFDERKIKTYKTILKSIN